MSAVLTYAFASVTFAAPTAAAARDAQILSIVTGRRLQGEIDRIPSACDLRVDTDPTSGNLIISGHVGDRQQAQDGVDRVNGLAGPYLHSDGKVVDRLALDTMSLVSIKVDVLEVDKTAQSISACASVAPISPRSAETSRKRSRSRMQPR